MENYTKILEKVDAWSKRNKWNAALVVVLSTYFIYQFGKNMGEFLYHLTH